MTVPTVSCTHCGKNFTTDDLRGTSCRYCGTLFAHHARAAQQVAVINQMMADRNGNGIPDAYEGLVANAQANAMNQAFGGGYPPGGAFGQPMMGPPGMMNPMAPHAQPIGLQPDGRAAHLGAPMHAAHMQVAHVSRTVSKVALWVTLGVVAVIFLMTGLGIAVAFMLQP